MECDEYCQFVLRARQEDGVLDKCEIESDVVKYQPHGEDLKAVLVVASFPCQARSVNEVNFKIHFFSESVLLQWSSGARECLPLGGRAESRMCALRSLNILSECMTACLVGGCLNIQLKTDLFRYWFGLIFWNESFWLHPLAMHRFLYLKLSRPRALLLENVGALLSCQRRTRELFAYICKKFRW